MLFDEIIHILLFLNTVKELRKIFLNKILKKLKNK